MAVPAKSSPQEKKKLDLFNSGFIDVQNGGQLNASARVIRLFVGEPGKVEIPISLYTGVSGGSLNSNQTSYGRHSEQVALSLINPTSGLINIFSDVTIPRNPKNLSYFQFEVDVGHRVLALNNVTTGKPVTASSPYLTSSIIAKTGAWERGKEKAMGMFWITIRYHIIKTQSNFQTLTGLEYAESDYLGYSIGTGIEINNRLNFRAFYYKYLNPQHGIFSLQIFQFTFNYNLVR